ncbi:hypothetical protein BD770DRAFT_451024 [Pilaira anomala]|nr:hypothetical protein BD770DRAFT_451024 [Pilaira anomala]
MSENPCKKKNRPMLMTRYSTLGKSNNFDLCKSSIHPQEYRLRQSRYTTRCFNIKVEKKIFIILMAVGSGRRDMLYFFFMKTLKITQLRKLNPVHLPILRKIRLRRIMDVLSRTLIQHIDRLIEYIINNVLIPVLHKVSAVSDYPQYCFHTHVMVTFELFNVIRISSR